MFRKVGLWCVIVLVLAGCSVSASKTPPAVEMLPNLPDYNVVKGETLTEHIGKLSQGAALLTGQPQLAVTIVAVDHVISCYQEIGAVQAQIYSHKEMPLQSGIVGIADRNELLSPANLFKCVIPSSGGGREVKFDPCTASYTLERDDNEFYIIYAGTTEDMCKTFCAELEGCTEHK